MTLTFAFGGPGDESGGVLGLGIPLLGGEPREAILEEAGPSGRGGSFSLWRGSSRLAGFARVDPEGDLRGAAERIYADLLGAARGLSLYRIWNLVPRINEVGPGGLENYRSFCLGRSLAFEKAFGAGFAQSLPAASAVGTSGPALAVAFLAGSAPASNLENPEQVPAYSYPAEHGPRPPSFSRATVVERGGRVDAFVAGTSAIAGHSTVSPHDTAGQLARTLRNLKLVSRECGLGDDLAAGRAESRHFKVFLRKPSDRAAAARALEGGALRAGDRVSYLCADICRSELNVEVEVAVRGAERI